MFISHTIGLFDNMGGDAENEASEGMTKIQCELLHMFGAVMAASKVSAITLPYDEKIGMEFNLMKPLNYSTHSCLYWLIV